MIVNMGLIILGSNLIPVSEGVDSMNAINWELTNFIFPFLAHTLRTLVGAFLAAKIANSYQLPLAMSIGVFFLIGGVTMGYLGWIIAKKV